MEVNHEKHTREFTRRIRDVFSKERWGAASNWQLAAILVVFAITGSLSVKLVVIVTQFMGLDGAATSPWIFWPVRIFLSVPIYQVVLIAVGTLFGQRKFFWNFEKKILRRFGLKSSVTS